MNSNGKFMDGFLLGAIIGGAAVFLFTTDKGRKILKTLSEEGPQGLSKAIESLVAEEKKEIVKKAEPTIKEVEKKVGEEIEEKLEVIKKEVLEPISSNKAPNKEKSGSRRFFRRK